MIAIKVGRAKQGFNQKQLAEIMGVTVQTVSNWEQSRAYPSVHQLVKLSLNLDVTLDELCNDIKK